MNLISWTPFRDMEGFFDRYNRLLMNETGAVEGKEFSWRPSADISETKKYYMIKAELPEVEKENMNVSIENGMLTISGERRHEAEEESETRHRVERMYGKFSRSFSLPADIDETKISAETKNGVLTVKLPKTKVVEPKPVQIAVK